MPYYEYICEDCNHEFEEEMPYTQRHNAVCPKCSSRDTVLQASTTNVSFTGVGFYETDYRKKKGEAS